MLKGLVFAALINVLTRYCCATFELGSGRDKTRILYRNSRLIIDVGGQITSGEMAVFIPNNCQVIRSELHPHIDEDGWCLGINQQGLFIPRPYINSAVLCSVLSAIKFIDLVDLVSNSAYFDIPLRNIHSFILPLWLLWIFRSLGRTDGIQGKILAVKPSAADKYVKDAFMCTRFEIL